MNREFNVQKIKGIFNQSKTTIQRMPRKVIRTIALASSTVVVMMAPSVLAMETTEQPRDVLTADKNSRSVFAITLDTNAGAIQESETKKALATTMKAVEISTTLTTTTIATTTKTTAKSEETETEEAVVEEEADETYYDEYDDYDYDYNDYTYEEEDNTTYSESDNDVTYSGTSDRNISDYEYNLLINLTSSEYGSSWVPTDEKSKIAATVLNIADTYYDGSITDAIYNSCVPYGFDPSYDYYKDETIYDAVDNVIGNEEGWSDWTATSWCGDGTYNYFN